MSTFRAAAATSTKVSKADIGKTFANVLSLLSLVGSLVSLLSDGSVRLPTSSRLECLLSGTITGCGSGNV